MKQELPGWPLYHARTCVIGSLLVFQFTPYQFNCKLCLPPPPTPKVFYPISRSLFQMAKRRKHSISTFQKEWSTSWSCIQPVKEHMDKALCTVCKSTFGIAHQGKRDVQHHVEGYEHKWLAQIVNSCQSVSSFSPNSSSHGKIVIFLQLLFWNTIYCTF